ncbi:MAG: HAMP domain-containing sensor histidine kinase [Coleofasciculaceae cyanobacterium]
MDLIYLLVGLGLGLLGSRITQSQPQSGVHQTPVSQTTTSQDQIEPLKQELQQTQLAYEMAKRRSQFKGGFLLRTVHELRSPLSSLIGMHQLILSDLCQSREEERSFVTEANRSAQKIVKLLDEVIAVAKTEYGTLRLDQQTVQLVKAFAELEERTFLAEKNPDLFLEIVPPEPDLYVLADPRRLRQVLVGILNSAIAQIKEGSIKVSAARVPGEQAVHIWMDVKSPNPLWREPVDSLHSTSEREEQESQTTLVSDGLNLLIVDTLVQVMQGRLEVVLMEGVESNGSSQATQLTRLECSLPLAKPEVLEIDG